MKNLKRILSILIVAGSSRYYLSRSNDKPTTVNIVTKLNEELTQVPISDDECVVDLTFEYNLDSLLHSNYSHPDYSACWKPADCTRGQKTLLVIPYRNREPALRASIPVLHHLLRLQKRDYCLLVAEQADHNFFNKALLMNAAFLESEQLGDFNCFIFHDVDMLPEVGELLYSCDKQPIHLSPAVSKFYYNLNYGTDFGGVVAISKAQFQHVNGYSNRFWGWGGEDDEMNMRIYASGLSRIRADPMIGRFFMLEHQHDWGFDPSRKMTIGTGDPIFRELRQKYHYSRDEVLGSKPNDWRKDGLNNARYKTVSCIESPKGFHHLMVDVSTTRLAALEIELIGSNTVNTSVNYEESRLSEQPRCDFLSTIGYLPQSNTTLLNGTFDSIEAAQAGCQKEKECFGISKSSTKFRLHKESGLLSTRFYSVVSGGNNVTTTDKQKGTVYLKQCHHRMEQLNQVLNELQLNQHEYTYAQLNINLIADIAEKQELYIYTTLEPIQEIGTSDFVYYRAQKGSIKRTVRNRIELIKPSYFKDGKLSATFMFNLPSLPGSYEARTVITDKNARPIGLYRWAWVQTAPPTYDANILRVVHFEPPFPKTTAHLHSGWLRLHNQVI